MIKQEEIFDIIIDSDESEKDFIFIGDDGKEYEFSFSNYHDLCEHYSEENVLCDIGYLDEMINNGLCRLKTTHNKN